jgi:F-box interacting protein
MHLNKSSRNLHVAQWRSDLLKDQDASFVTLSIPDLIQKKITILHNRPLHRSLNCGEAVGSCNGLICFICYSYHSNSDRLCFWNPAMRTLSRRFSSSTIPYSFGYDNTTGTYKVVAFCVERGCNKNSVVKVFTLGNNPWRDIQCFPVLPLYWSDRNKNNGVYLSGTINWLALRNYSWTNFSSDWFKGVTVEQYVIVSLDLSTESYT